MPSNLEVRPQNHSRPLAATSHILASFGVKERDGIAPTGIVCASVTQDVTSIEARRRNGWIRCRVVDQYGRGNGLVFSIIDSNIHYRADPVDTLRVGEGDYEGEEEEAA